MHLLSRVGEVNDVVRNKDGIIAQEPFFVIGSFFEGLAIVYGPQIALLLIDHLLVIRIKQTATFLFLITARHLRLGKTSNELSVLVNGDALQSIFVFVRLPRNCEENNLTIVTQDQVVAIFLDRIKTSIKDIDRPGITVLIDERPSLQFRKFVVIRN